MYCSVFSLSNSVFLYLQGMGIYRHIHIPFLLSSMLLYSLPLNTFPVYTSVFVVQ